MNSRLRVLPLEDSPRDAELIRFTLEDGDFECDLVVVENRTDFTKQLSEGQFDLILSDYGLADYDGACEPFFSLWLSHEKSL